MKPFPVRIELIGAIAHKGEYTYAVQLSDHRTYNTVITTSYGGLEAFKMAVAQIVMEIGR